MKMKNGSNVWLWGIFFVWMILNLYGVTPLPVKELALASTQWLCFAMIFAAGVSWVQQSELDRNLLPFYRGFLLFAGLYVLLQVVRVEGAENGILTGILLNLAFLWSVVHVKFDKKVLVLFAWLSIAVTFLLMMQWAACGLPASDFQSYIRNPNILGVFVSCLAFFPLAAFRLVPGWQKGVFLLACIGDLLLILASSARAVLLLLAVVVGARVIMALSRKAFSFVFHAVMLFNAVFILVYGLLARSSYFASLNEWSMNSFGKGFFSGRQNIWGPALHYGLEKPLFGYSIGIAPSEYIDGRFYKHAHNQFLQIFLESGFVGVIAFLLMLFGIWKVYQKGLDNPVVRWSACFFLGILVYQSVEISLFENIEQVGLFQWLVIGMGLSGVHWMARDEVPIDEEAAPSSRLIQSRRAFK